MRAILAIASFAAVSLLSSCQQAAQPHPVIVAHVDAFNVRDFAAMSRVDHPDIEWLTVSGSDVTVDVQGRETLMDVVRNYTDANPTVIGSLGIGASTATMSA